MLAKIPLPLCTKRFCNRPNDVRNSARYPRRSGSAYGNVKIGSHRAVPLHLVKAYAVIPNSQLKQGGIVLKKKFLSLTLAAALSCSLLAGCQTVAAPAETTIFAMDTVMSLTLYGDKSQETLTQCVETIYTLETQLSATSENSFLSQLNRGEATTPPDEVGDLLTKALRLCNATEGALDLTAYPAVKAWGFTTGEYRVPDQEELSALAAVIDYSAVEVDPSSNQITLPAGMELDLGAVAKGYTADRLVEMLASRGITSALLDLGQSTIQVVGTKPDGTPWRVGIQDPAGEGYLGILEIADEGLGTSGGYQRFFEEDGVPYWHIIDPDTAAPARTGLGSVTVVSPSGLVCDGLSTALFVMGLEEGTQFWRDHPELNFEVLFITDEGDLFLTAGLEDVFSLAQGCEDREVTVLK